MKQRSLLWLLVGLSLLFSSCSGTVQKMRRKVKLEGIEDVRPTSLSSVRIDFRIMNQTAYNLHLKDAVAHLYYRDNCIGTMRLKERVEVPKRTASELFPTDWTDYICSETMGSYGEVTEPDATVQISIDDNSSVEILVKKDV